jgi:hypothetical protein
MLTVGSVVVVIKPQIALKGLVKVEKVEKTKLTAAWGKDESFKGTARFPVKSASLNSSCARYTRE